MLAVTTNGGAYGNRLAEVFGMPEAPPVVTRTLHECTVGATEIKCPRNFGRTAPIPREEAYLVGLQLQACNDHDLYFDRQRIRPTNFVKGATSVYDLTRGPVSWDLRDADHCVMFYLPRNALDGVAHELGAARIDRLRAEPGVGIDDPIVRNLLSSLRPVAATTAKPSALFLDHTVLALCAHIAQRYGGIDPIAPLSRGGLAPWQERRAKEMMSAKLNEELPLTYLATECGLSVRHFARAFRQSTGVPPHRWLLKRRVERAKALLSNHELSLADIAASCGFADQSHFTRVFAAMAAVSPGAWRRMKEKS